MTEKAVIIIGAGGHARVLLDTLLLTDTKVIGFLDNDISLTGERFCGIPVLGTDDDLARYCPDEVDLVNGIGSIGVAAIRKAVFHKLKEKGYFFRQAIHPSAVISPRAYLGEGVQVMAGAVVNIGSRIEDNAIVNTKVSIDHDCYIGKHVHIAPGCTLSGGVSVGDGTLIGTGSSVIQGITIGNNTLIGAGSLVIRDIPSKVKAFGAPAHIL